MEDNKPLDDLLEGEFLDGKPAKKKMKKSTLIIIIIAAVVVLCCCIAAVVVVIGMFPTFDGNNFMDFSRQLTQLAV